MFDLLENHIEFAKYDVGTKHVLRPDVLAPFPKLGNFYKQFVNRPRIALHVHSKSRFPFEIPNIPKTRKKQEWRDTCTVLQSDSVLITVFGKPISAISVKDAYIHL